ncbi:ABC-F family ATPase [Leptospira biflexa]|jgi:ATPase subunit of ABC transporter with duplicated ATPase domains|uniref:Probable ATP-binding protein YbiT n=1 Tax=Leptospira biflexa serovar Patoc (strain Patoc 1 / ATCC 23582 / Paris) TaxID=456481 RepID=B0SML9_LEPBP|nr:ATP-binding cassette domain-containing protein [Leptospira biflexa]ABZ95067.1 ATP-binding protein of an ABC transporter complex [Leptospira biflexa serovar Patoc strain 'Patoc 1 (Ames)']ABZ98743.1 ABC-type transport system, ATP-binding component [Leptospira biflexa serovar Patoc strain 'Patoc 1 (Paris)']TGM33750.1 ABC-F family ATPase [Leptospira biflexa]TGM35383.1 ABC-F family ATPase [Leptospira biflexa]TGM42484.1 ABC-F family ATPase [Leptospira biflexa]
MIQASGITVSFGKKPLFENVSIKFKPECRYGLIGANGSGKSTFMKVLAGILQPSAGSVVLDKDIKVGYLKQDHYEYENETVLGTVLRGNPELWSLMAERDAIYAKEDMTDEEGIRISEIEELFADMGGYEAESVAGELLEGLGIPTTAHSRPLNFLTGGFKLRVLLAQVLFLKPDVLLLDEPTNHLDIKTIHWLEELLTNYEGVVIVISHDRHFINSVATHIADLDYNTIRVFPGNYDDFMIAAEQSREQLMSDSKRAKEKIADLQEFVSRFSANASKSKQATSRQKMIEKIKADMVDVKPSSRVAPYIRFKAKRVLGKDVFEAINVSKSYDGKPVIKDFSISITKGEKVGIVGTNGVGKTTLLKMLLKKLEPDSGQVKWGDSVETSFFPQDHREAMEPDADTLVEWLLRNSPQGTEVQEIRAILGRMLFSGDMANKSTTVLSGGEKSRMIIGKMILACDNVIALDEPTNHLDLETIEALNYALSLFDGTVILVSHDREFISSLCTRIIEVTPEGINDFKGNYEEFLEREGSDFYKRLTGGAILST